MKKLKVVTVVGTRPEIIRLSRVMAALDRDCDHVLVHTGQNYDYELNEIFFQDLGIRKPDHFLNAAGATGAETIGNVIISVDRVLAEVAGLASDIDRQVRSAQVVALAPIRLVRAFLRRPLIVGMGGEERGRRE